MVLARTAALPRARRLAERLGAEVGEITAHTFPDGETKLTLPPDLAGRRVVLLSSLDHPDPRLFPLWMAARGAKAQGAARVDLCAPYLPYLRQDRAFAPGEVVSAAHLGAFLSACVDGLVTVDPHLHRITDLSQVFTIPTRVVKAAAAMAAFVAAEVADPVLIGPDEESEQWVADVAGRIGAPFAVLRKERRGDHEVEITVPDPALLRGRTPVLVDDMASTARTLIQATASLRRAGGVDPVCVVVHALFVGDAWPALLAAGAARVASADTVPHESNAFSMDEALADALRELA